MTCVVKCDVEKGIWIGQLQNTVFKLNDRDLKGIIFLRRDAHVCMLPCVCVCAWQMV